VQALSISADPTFTKADSAVFLRHQGYTQEIGQLAVVVYKKLPLKSEYFYSLATSLQKAL